MRGQEEEGKSEKVEGRGRVQRQGGFREAKHVAQAGRGPGPGLPAAWAVPASLQGADRPTGGPAHVTPTHSAWLPARP